MTDVLDGKDCIKGELVGFNKINVLKNCYYGDEPSDPATGLLWRSSADEILRQWDGAAWQIIPFYEVDDWEPGITFGGNSNLLTYDTRGGRYVKLGDWVTLTGWIFLSNKGDSGGVARITDLPFTCKDSAFNFACPSLRLENISFANQHTSFVQRNTKTIELQEVTEGGVLTALEDTDFEDNSTIIISVTYEIEI